MLVVIAVIGVLTAIAIPMIGRINEQAQAAKDSRNAQAFVTMYNAAKAGGAAAQLDDDSEANAMTALRTGISVPDITDPRCVSTSVSTSTTTEAAAIEALVDVVAVLQ